MSYFHLGVALLPFVDEKRLHRALSKVYGDLTDDESMYHLYVITDLGISYGN